MTFEDWLKIGQSHGWASRVFCYTHNEPPTDRDEDRQWAEDLEPPCMNVVRLYEPTRPTLIAS